MSTVTTILGIKKNGKLDYVKTMSIGLRVILLM